MIEDLISLLDYITSRDNIMIIQQLVGSVSIGFNSDWV